MLNRILYNFFCVYTELTYIHLLANKIVYKKYMCIFFNSKFVIYYCIIEIYDFLMFKYKNLVQLYRLNA